MNTTTKPGVLAAMDAHSAMANAIRVEIGGASVRVNNAGVDAAKILDELNRIAIGQREARATVERMEAALADAVDWIAAMRCDDATTHPRLKVLRAALAQFRGEA